MYIHAYTYWHHISGTTIFMNIAIVQSNLVLPPAWLRAESHPAKPWLRASWAKNLAHSSDSAAKWVEWLWVALSHSSRFIISIYGNNICSCFPSSVAQKQVPMLVWGVCDTLWVHFFLLITMMTHPINGTQTTLNCHLYPQVSFSFDFLYLTN